MDGRSSLYLIALLLAALFLGPVVVLTQDRPGHKTPALRALPPSERVTDAPAPLERRPGSRAALPDARPANAGLPIFPK